MTDPGTSAARPRSGDVLRIGREASVQFTGENAIVLRVIRVHDWATYDGWLWLDGYVLNAAGAAIDRRTVFVQQAGVQPVGPPPAQVSRYSASPRP